jgi:lipoprotein-releasing system permease protein
MKRIDILFAWRYVWGTAYEKNISTMVIVCFLSILIAAFSLTLVLGIMTGFEKETHAKLQGIHAQIIMHAGGDALDIPKISDALTKEFPEIEAFSPTTLRQAIIQSETEEDISNVIILKGIDPANEAKSSSLEKKIIKAASDDKKLATLVTKNQLIIGKKLAKTLMVKPGETITLLYTREDQRSGRKLALSKKDAIISGIFDTGIEEFDSGLAVCSLELIDELWPDTGATQINIKLKAAVDEEKTIKALRKRFGMEAYSWKDMYPALVSALKLEKYGMFFILVLIVLVASMNIISLLFMHITQKRGDIAILKAMGMHNSMLVRIFLLFSTLITGTASIIGLLLAWIAGLILQHYPFITLPDAYYVSHLPVSLEWHLFILVFVVVMIISVIASWIPIRKTVTINIADVLRFEA